ncbi:2-oxoglutarate dehydrogenase E2 component (dihydrolipoamide succinyltransferase) [Bacteroides sp. HPS0048]|uniref:dihydrolipoamide acetyltransferase family protein n=1 Tax=Bacteroides sp. HPS0048 TaxID=1078089 RepID=UPI000368D6C0|nr:dihydrolipoamide acetyltransferase family protein [Bacteroides sp. HPS0048]EOA55459.1 2-oxoglutarate dehydrogenase E2 component (dihydrolipoamide succinyltransferase) [Bacteroides sp. HPS0048]
MAKFEIKMPKLGESVTEGTIISWSVQVGDVVQEDDVLFEVNTAKVSAEVPSPVAGKVVEILFKEGDTVPVGTVVALVDMGGEGEQEETETEQPASGMPTSDSPQEKAVKAEEERWYSPVVLQLAREAKILREELDTIPGTGYEGRLSKKDIKDYIARKKSGSSAAPKVTVQQAAAISKEAPVSTAPVTSPVSAATTAPVAPVVSPAPVARSTSDMEVKPMDFVRKIIADHMVMSKKVSPHVTNVVEVDVTRLVHWREKNKDAFFRREGVKLTYMPVITEAVAKALVAYPQVNVSVDGYNILFKKHINIGVAVSLNDGNLIVPVIHDADRLNLNGLALSINSLALKARNNKLTPDEISGGTFTITNYGTFKMLFGTPVINQPEVAILGVGSIEKKPVVKETPEGDVIAIRHKMYLSLSYDHRIVDGSLGGNFLHFIADYLERFTSE